MTSLKVIVFFLRLGLHINKIQNSKFKTYWLLGPCWDLWAKDRSGSRHISFFFTIDTLYIYARKQQQTLSSVRVYLFRKKINFSEGGSCTREPYICIRSQFAADLLMHGQQISNGEDNFRQSHGQTHRGPRFSSYRVVAEYQRKIVEICKITKQFKTTTF